MRTTDHPASDPPARRARTAIGVIFFANGAVLASWIAHIPDAKAAHALSDGALGLVLLAMSAGAILAMPVADDLTSAPGAAPALRVTPSIDLRGGSQEPAPRGEPGRGDVVVGVPAAVGYAAPMSSERPAGAPRRYALQSIFGPGDASMTSHTPHAAHLGIRVVETGPGFGVCALPFREELIGDPGRRLIFGGAITTLIDHASGLAVACAVEELTAIATIDLRVDYLRAAEPDVELYARSECYRLTRNVAFVRAVAYERTVEEAFATAMGTFLLGANRTDSPFGARGAAAKGGAT